MKKDKPLILIVNDDGITAKGIRALIGFVKHLANIVVVAPNKSMSGMSHAISINDPLRFSKFKIDPEITEYTCSGTPVDCVKFGTSLAVEGKTVDLVLSGINHGQNSSINALYSGTVGAAMEGAIGGIPSLALSLCDHSADADFSICETSVIELVKKGLNKELPRDSCLNVNFPAIPKNQLKGIKICRQSNARWGKDFQKMKDPTGNDYYWLSGDFQNLDEGKDTDIWALDHGFVSVVPMKFDLTAHDEIKSLKHLE